MRWAVVGITAIVIMLFDLTGEPVRSLAGWRMVDTVIAGVVALAAALILPNATGSVSIAIWPKLARFGIAYSDAVFAGAPDAMTRCREAVLGARLKAEAAAVAAAQEPVSHALDPGVALAIADLRLVSAQLLRWDELLGTVAAPPELAARAPYRPVLPGRPPGRPPLPWPAMATAGDGGHGRTGPVGTYRLGSCSPVGRPVHPTRDCSTG